MIITEFARGTVYGTPGDHQQQRRILQATLALLEQDAPLDPVRLDESLETEA
jgi:hypothetical protein